MKFIDLFEKINKNIMEWSASVKRVFHLASKNPNKILVETISIKIINECELLLLQKCSDDDITLLNYIKNTFIKLKNNK